MAGLAIAPGQGFRILGKLQIIAKDDVLRAASRKAKFRTRLD